MKLFAIGSEDQAIIFFKVLIFLVLIVLIAVRGLFQVESDEHGSMSIRVVTLLLLGVMSADGGGALCLCLSLAHRLLEQIFTGGNILWGVYNNSRKQVRIMVDFANVWFFLPGVAFIILGIIRKNRLEKPVSHP
ncbi:MAG: hypothetical protein U0519_03810 [Candidatus Gracilibacteria bacterium]